MQSTSWLVMMYLLLVSVTAKVDTLTKVVHYRVSSHLVVVVMAALWKHAGLLALSMLLHG